MYKQNRHNDALTGERRATKYACAPFCGLFVFVASPSIRFASGYRNTQEHRAENASVRDAYTKAKKNRFRFLNVAFSCRTFSYTRHGRQSDGPKTRGGDPPGNRTVGWRKRASGDTVKAAEREWRMPAVVIVIGIVDQVKSMIRVLCFFFHYRHGPAVLESKGNAGGGGRSTQSFFTNISAYPFEFADPVICIVRIFTRQRLPPAIVFPIRAQSEQSAIGYDNTLTTTVFV